MSVDYQLHGKVAVITLNSPPDNRLGFETRRALSESLDAAIGDAQVEAIVLTGADGLFSAGAELSELGAAGESLEPSLSTLTEKVEQSPKPVVAAIDGLCTDGGLELALACHGRLATGNARLGLTQAKVGLLPSAGGTQRLPRLVGVEKALNMIMLATVTPAKTLADTKLLDQVVAGDLLAQAVAFAEKLAACGAPPRVRDRKIEFPEAEAYFGFARSMVSPKSLPGAAKCVEAVTASTTMKFEDGLKLENTLYQQQALLVETKARVYLLRAEKIAAKIPDIPADTPVRPLKAAAVIGAGTMGSGIVMALLNAGLKVSVFVRRPELLDKTNTAMFKSYESTLKKGKLSQEQFDDRMNRLTMTLDYKDFGDADIAIETVVEEWPAKQAVFEQLDAVLKPGAILASNTSTLDVNKIAQFTKRPQDVVGTHFFSPAHLMRLMEVIRGSATSKETMATVMKLATMMGKTAVVSGVCDGFIGNRILDPYRRQAYFMQEEGAPLEQIDKAAEKFGMIMGSFRMHDLAGNDVSWLSRKRRYIEQPGMRRLPLPDLICDTGRFGQKTGAGWYDYKPGDRTAYPSPTVRQMVEEYYKANGITPRKFTDEEIVERMIYALVNEGAKTLEEGIAARASDIDVIYTTGYGFPVARGGPMFYAETVGLHNVVQVMKRFAANPCADSDFWKPAPLLVKLAAENKTFSSEGY